MNLFKKTISAKEATRLFVGNLLEETKSDYNEIIESLSEHYENFKIEKKKNALIDFLFARISLEFVKIHDLFQKNEASEIIIWIFHWLDTPEDGEYARIEINEYYTVFVKELKLKQHPPFAAVTGRLLGKWLGNSVKNFTVTIGNKTSNIISPTLIQETTIGLLDYKTSWSEYKKRYNLTYARDPLTN